MRAQVTNYATTETSATNTLYYALLLGGYRYVLGHTTLVCIAEV